MVEGDDAMVDGDLAGLLERAAESERGVRFLDRREEARFYPYAELLARARRTGAALAARGVEPGDRVALLLATGPEFYDAFFGASLIGAVPAPLYPPVRLGRLAEYHDRTAALIRGCSARIVIADRRTSRIIGRAVEAASPPRGLMIVRQASEPPAAGDGAGPDDSVEPGRGAAPGRGAERRARPKPSDPALIQHSSGTTGIPRPVRLTHRAVLANVGAIRARLLEAYPRVEDVEHAAVSWLPLYHDMGLIGCVITAMAHPVDLTLIPPELFVARPGVWLRAISRYRATVSGAPNFAYSYCAARVADDDLRDVDLSSWRVALNGAEPVTAGAMERFGRRFGPHGFRIEALTPVYGLAEATLAVTFSDPAVPYRAVSFARDPLVREGLARPVENGSAEAKTAATLVSVGRPLDGVRLRIAPLNANEGQSADANEGEPRDANAGESRDANEAGSESAGPSTGARDADDGAVRDGEIGRVLVAGPSLFDGYDGTGRVPDGASSWFDTGDTGFMLDGELFLYSRAKDVLVIRGRKHAPEEVERAVHGVAGARPGCVAAISAPPRPGEAERLVLLVERAREPRAVSDDDLRERVRERVATATDLACDRVAILEPGTLPRTSSGKIRRAEARRRYLTGELAPPGPASMAGLFAEAVRSRLAIARVNRRADPPPAPEDG